MVARGATTTARRSQVEQHRFRTGIRTARKRPANEPHVAFAVPGDLDTPNGGYRYDRRIIEELRRLGWHVDVLDIGDCFPFPSASERTGAVKMLHDVPVGCPIVVDGLAFGALPEAGSLQMRTPLVALVHQPLALASACVPAQVDALRD